MLCVQLEKEGGKESGKEEHTSGEEEEDEDEEPAPGTLSGASQMQDSAILDDFINGASLQVTERNGEHLSADPDLQHSAVSTSFRTLCALRFPVSKRRQRVRACDTWRME